MQQIPNKLLPLTALVRVPDEDADRGGSFMEAVEVKGVRYDRSQSVRHTDYQMADNTTGVLFMDSANSAGAFEVPAGSKVSVDGGSVWMSVNACHPYEDYSGHVHHWELELR